MYQPFSNYFSPVIQGTEFSSMFVVQIFNRVLSFLILRLHLAKLSMVVTVFPNSVMVSEWVFEVKYCPVVSSVFTSGFFHGVIMFSASKIYLYSLYYSISYIFLSTSIFSAKQWLVPRTIYVATSVLIGCTTNVD